MLLCYPIAAEYMRAHRAFRQLNLLLNRSGANVLRFDYSCTGDSAGSGVDASVEDWLDDIDWAIDELKDNAMCDEVSIVGLRWGGTLAALAASPRADVRQLVLWDPIASGASYLEREATTVGPTTTINDQGYPLTPELREQLAAIDLVREPPDRFPNSTSLIVAESRPDYDELVGILQERAERPDYSVVPSPGDWGKADPFGDALIPQEIIGAIAGKVTGDMALP